MGLSGESQEMWKIAGFNLGKFQSFINFLKVQIFSYSGYSGFSKVTKELTPYEYG